MHFYEFYYATSSIRKADIEEQRENLIKCSF